MKLSAALLRWEPEEPERDRVVSRPCISPWTLFKEGLEAFVDDHALTRGAAIAFYAVTAIAPVLFIATAIAALVLGQDAASGAVYYQLRRIMSPESADLVQLAILHVRGSEHTLAGSLIGITTLVVVASGFFTEIEDALNVIWKAPRKESYFYQILRGRVMSLTLVIMLGFLLLLSMLVATGVRMLGQLLKQVSEISELVIGISISAFRWPSSRCCSPHCTRCCPTASWNGAM
jgi:membrane protein